MKRESLRDGILHYFLIHGRHTSAMRSLAALPFAKARQDCRVARKVELTYGPAASMAGLLREELGIPAAARDQMHRWGRVSVVVSGYSHFHATSSEQLPEAQSGTGGQSDQG